MKPINRVRIHEFCDRSVGIGSSGMSETLPSIFETGLGKLSDILSRVDRGHICATVTKGHFTQTLLCTGIISDYRNLLVYDSVRRLRYKREAREIGFVKDAGVTRSLLSPVSGTKKRVDDVVAPRTIHDIPEHVLTCGLTLPGKSDKFFIFISMYSFKLFNV